MVLESTMLFIFSRVTSIRPSMGCWLMLNTSVCFEGSAMISIGSAHSSRLPQPLKHMFILQLHKRVKRRCYHYNR